MKNNISKNDNGMYVGKRICPKCKNEITHRCSKIDKLKSTIKRNSPCEECTRGKNKPYNASLYKIINPVFIDNKWCDTRNCPECGVVITYSSNKIYFLRRSIRNANRENYLCSHCNGKGEKNNFFGKKHSEKTKKQVSKSRTGKAMGKNNAMSNPENRKKVSEGLKKAWASGDLDYLRKILSDLAKQSHADGKIKGFPVSNYEKTLKKILESNFLCVVPQFIINSLKYDFYIKDKNLLIEFNGDYWHCNPEKYQPGYFHTVKQMTATQLWEQDEKKRQLAINSGYNFITIWEKDFNKNREREIQKILQYE